MRSAALVVLGLVCASACGGQSERRRGAPAPTSGAPSAAGGGSGGAAGDGGVAASGGLGGILPTGGSAGTSGGSAGAESVGGTTGAGAPGDAGRGSGGNATSGSGGGSGSAGAEIGGMAGVTGKAGAASFPECTVNEDCEIANDCCACQAVPKGASFGACRVACGDSNACEMQGLAAVAQCTLGRCTLATSCSALRTTCDSLPPACPAGETASVTEGGCWGPCVASTECADVTDCDACGDAHCVKFPNVGGTTIRCISREAGCESGNLCECLAPCGSFGCGEQNGEVGCFCVAC